MYFFKNWREKYTFSDYNTCLIVLFRVVSHVLSVYHILGIIWVFTGFSPYPFYTLHALTCSGRVEELIHHVLFHGVQSLCAHYKRPWMTAQGSHQMLSWMRLF